jgi:hypothetical protein
MDDIALAAGDTSTSLSTGNSSSNKSFVVVGVLSNNHENARQNAQPETIGRSQVETHKMPGFRKILCQTGNI